MTQICFFKLLGLKRVNCESKIWVKREATCKVRRWVEELCWRERVDSITVRCRSSAIDAIDVEEEEDDDDSDEDKASFFCCCSEESDTDTGAEAEASSPLDAVSAISSSPLALLCFVLFCIFAWAFFSSFGYYSWASRPSAISISPSNIHIEPIFLEFGL